MASIIVNDAHEQRMVDVEAKLAKLSKQISVLREKAAAIYNDTADHGKHDTYVYGVQQSETSFAIIELTEALNTL